MKLGDAPIRWPRATTALCLIAALLAIAAIAAIVSIPLYYSLSDVWEHLS